MAQSRPRAGSVIALSNSTRAKGELCYTTLTLGYHYRPTMPWYIVKKRVKGNLYLYRQRSWREGDAVRTESQYIGPYAGSWHEAKETKRSARQKAEIEKPIPPVITTARLSRLERWRLWLRASREFDSFFDMIRTYRLQQRRGYWRQDEEYWGKQMAHQISLMRRHREGSHFHKLAGSKWDGMLKKRSQIRALIPLLDAGENASGRK